MLLAAGLWVGCSPHTKMDDAKPETVAGANEGGNAGRSALGGSGSGQAGSHALTGPGGSTDGGGGSAGSTISAGGTGTTGSTTGGDAGDTAGVSGTGGEPNKIVLFDGTPESFNNWYARNGGTNSANPWTYNDDGTMTPRGDDILSKMPFTNVFVHVEYVTLKFNYSPNAEPQLRGNSGVFLHGSYELAVIDSFGRPPANDLCGSVYARVAPLVSACNAGGEWNTCDIEFRASECANGVKTANARFVEVKLNGILIHEDVEVSDATQAGLSETCSPRGVLLQSHATSTPVTFRNIWAIARD